MKNKPLLPPVRLICDRSGDVTHIYSRNDLLRYEKSINENYKLPRNTLAQRFFHRKEITRLKQIDAAESEKIIESLKKV